MQKLQSLLLSRIRYTSQGHHRSSTRCAQLICKMQIAVVPHLLLSRELIQLLKPRESLRPMKEAWRVSVRQSLRPGTEQGDKEHLKILPPPLRSPMPHPLPLNMIKHQVIICQVTFRWIVPIWNPIHLQLSDICPLLKPICVAGQRRHQLKWRREVEWHSAPVLRMFMGSKKVELTRARLVHSQNK